MAFKCFHKTYIISSLILTMSLEGKMKECWVVDLGTIDYDEALRLQEKLAELRGSGKIPDTLLLLEHPPVITFGAENSEDLVRVSDEVLQKEGIKKHPTRRGGEVFYHGPGQVVGYVIKEIRVDRTRQDMYKTGEAREHVHKLEEVMARALASYGVGSATEGHHPGTWCFFNGEDRKIGARAIQVKHHGGIHVTMHGFALNINPNLAHFDFIYPCGFKDKGTTSLQQVLGREVPMEEAKQRVADAFANVFGYERIERKTPEELKALIK